MNIIILIWSVNLFQSLLGVKLRYVYIATDKRIAHLIGHMKDINLSLYSYNFCFHTFTAVSDLKQIHTCDYSLLCIWRRLQNAAALLFKTDISNALFLCKVGVYYTLVQHILRQWFSNGGKIKGYAF